MPDSNQPSCWRAAALTFAIMAGLILIAGLVGGGEGAAVAVN